MNIIKLFFPLLVMLNLSCCACSSKEEGQGGSQVETPGTNEPVEEPTSYAYSWTTSADESKLFKQEELKFGSASSMSPYVVKPDGTSYQSVEGFGAAVTVSSCYNLLKMPKDYRTALLKNIFDKKTGIGSSLIRVCIGGSDFSWDYGDSGRSSDGRYTWCDKEGLENFEAHPMDIKYLIPVLKEIYAINPDVKIIGSPWTAPRWMKLDENLDKAYESWTGGRLNPKHYRDYGEYFVKWIQYMEAEGFNIFAVTPQNEPLNAGNSMSMLMYWDDCRDFVKNGLGPALRDAGLQTKILIFDHNFNYDNKADQKSYPTKVYADSEAASYIDGSAWHNYGGSPSELDNIVAAAPDKSIYFTEASIGEWNYTFSGCLINDFKTIFMETMSRGCKGVTLWNLMLDDRKGPYTNAGGSCTTCYGAVTILRSDYKTTKPYSHYYNIAHCSKVLQSGAVRLGTEGFKASGVSYQLYKNPDGSYGAIILNESTKDQQFVFAVEDHSVKCTAAARSIVSVLWKY